MANKDDDWLADEKPFDFKNMHSAQRRYDAESRSKDLQQPKGMSTFNKKPLVDAVLETAARRKQHYPKVFTSLFYKVKSQAKEASNKVEGVVNKSRRKPR